MRNPIPIRYYSQNQKPLKNIPCSLGIPFRNKEDIGSGNLSLTLNGAIVEECDFYKLPFYGDPAVFWLQANFFLREYHPDEDMLFVTDKVESGNTSGIEVSRSEEHIEIHTGVARFRLNTSEYFPFNEVAVHNNLVLSANKAPKILTDDTGKRSAGKIIQTEISDESKQKVMVYLKGTFAGQRIKKVEICFESVLTFFYGCAQVKIEFRLWNPAAAKHPGGIWDLGDPHSWHFRGLEIPFSFLNQTEVGFNTEPGALLAPVEPENEFWIHQNSSGNDNWKSLAHVDKNNEITVKFKGYKYKNGQEEGYGRQANPALCLKAEPEKNTGIAIAFEEFWQRFPTSLEWKGNQAVAGIFPVRDEQTFELQAGEKSYKCFWIDFDAQPSEDVLPAARESYAFSPEAPYMKQADCFPHLFQSSQITSDFYASVLKECLSGKDAIQTRIAKFEEWGWRNFGEIPADHERQYYAGEREFISHYNNQYDLILAFLTHFYSQGNFIWFTLSKNLATHVVHQDIYHTELDKPAFNGGYFWHTYHYLHAGTATHRGYSKLGCDGNPLPTGFGGGPSNEHNYSSGLMYLYLVTGERVFKDAVVQLANRVINLQDGTKTIFRWLCKGPTGLATSTRNTWFQGPGRGGAYSITALLDGYVITGYTQYLKELEKYIRICVHPDDNQDTLDLWNGEERWSYTVFLQTLGRYLDFKLATGMVDDMFHYARATLLNYVEWMYHHEHLYLDKPEILEYPTSTWPAQDMRKGCVFLYAARFCEKEHVARFIEKADYFFDGALKQLETFEDKLSIRNLVLIMNNYPMRFHAASHKNWNLNLGPIYPTDIKKIELAPQKSIALKRVKMIFGAVGVLCVAVIGFIISQFT